MHKHIDQRGSERSHNPAVAGDLYAQLTDVTCQGAVVSDVLEAHEGLNDEETVQSPA